MKNSRWLLFAGIGCLLTGILISILTNQTFLGNTFISIGVMAKIGFLAILIFSKKYQPGIEFLFLVAGLMLFFSGIVLENKEIVTLPSIFKITGIALKITFVFLLINKVRNKE